MLAFAKAAMPNTVALEYGDFHREIAEHLQDASIRKLNIIAPRGHAKSSIVAGVFVLWHLMFTPGPHFVVLVSRTHSHAIRLLQTIKDVLDYSAPFRWLFGYWGVNSARRWALDEVVLKNDDIIVTKGAGQMVVGLKHLNQRPTLVILDDPEDLNNTKTEEAMEQNQRWLFTQLLPTLDAHRGRIVVIGTPQHQLCMVETLKNTSGWKTLHYKGIREDGTALWPEMWPIERLLEEKASMESIGRVGLWYREYMCEIVSTDEDLFRDVQTYKSALLTLGTGYEHDLEITFNDDTKETLKVHIQMGVDPASSVSNSADYSTIVPVAIDYKSRRFVLPYFRGKVTPLQLAEKIFFWNKLYKPVKTRIEVVGYQEMLREYMKRESALRGEYIPGLEIKENPRTSKSSRIESMQPFFASKRVFIAKDMQPLEEELKMYPRGKHDDLLDGLYYAMKSIVAPRDPETLPKKEIVYFEEDIFAEDHMLV